MIDCLFCLSIQNHKPTERLDRAMPTSGATRPRNVAGVPHSALRRTPTLSPICRPSGHSGRIGRRASVRLRAIHICRTKTAPGSPGTPGRCTPSRRDAVRRGWRQAAARGQLDKSRRLIWFDFFVVFFLRSPLFSVPSDDGLVTEGAWHAHHPQPGNRLVSV